MIAERFFDEGGGMQLVIHAPFGARINKAWGLALRKRFCRSFNFELQAAATDNGINIALAEQHSFPLADVFHFLQPESVKEVLEQAVLTGSPIFQTRWRWDANRSLALLRFQGGKKVPPQIQRMRADDLLASVFPDVAACPENIEGEIQIPDHPLIHEVMKDVLTEAMDIDGLTACCAGSAAGEIRTVAVDTPVPSQFSHEILNANPYAYLDDAPLEERRARAVQMRRTLPESVLARSAASILPRSSRCARRRCRMFATPTICTNCCKHWWSSRLPSALAGWETLAAKWEPRSDGQLIANRRAVRGARVNERRVLGGFRSAAPEFRALFPASANSSPSRRRWPKKDSRRARIDRGLLGWLGHSGPVTAAESPRGSRAWSCKRSRTRCCVWKPTGAILRGHSERALPPTSRKVRQHSVEAGLMVRPALAGAHSSADCRPAAQAGRTGNARAVHALAAALAARGARNAAQRRTRLLEAHPAIAGIRDSGQRMGAADSGAARPRLRSRGARPPVPDRSRGLGTAVAASGDGRSGERSSAAADGLTESRRKASASAAWFQLQWLRSRFPARRVRLDAAAARRTSRSSDEGCRQRARGSANFLRKRGASFFADIVRGTGRLKAEVETGLWELVAAGLVTADGFDNLRALIDPRRRAGHGSQRTARPRHASGRWSLLYAGEPAERNRQVEATCWMLLHRYGVVFRELLARETGLPRWRELQVALRRLEDRGEIRGGRFIAGFIGEQFALPVAVESCANCVD